MKRHNLDATIRGWSGLTFTQQVGPDTVNMPRKVCVTSGLDGGMIAFIVVLTILSIGFLVVGTLFVGLPCELSSM